MATGTNGAAPAAPAPADTVAGASLADVLAAMQDVSGRLADMDDRLVSVERATPRMGVVRPQAPSTVARARVDQGWRSLPPGASKLGIGKQILVDKYGEKVPGMLLEQNPPRFQAGDPVMIDPDAAPHGADEGVTWGSIIDKLGVVACTTRTGRRRCGGRYRVNEGCPVCGAGPVVRKVGWLGEQDAWKYFVDVPGLTSTSPDGFRDSELIPA